MQVFSTSILSASCALLIMGSLACGNGENNPIRIQPKDTLPTGSAKPKPQSPIRGVFSPQKTLHFDRSAIGPFLASHPSFKSYAADIQQFYARRRYAYAWYDEHGMVEQADNLYNYLLNMHTEGLPQQIVYPDALNEIFDDPADKRNPEHELMLTAQYFRYASTVWGGISEKETKKMEWFLPRKKLDLPSLLDSMIRDSSLLGRGYSIRQYNLLKNCLRQYKGLDSAAGHTVLSGHQAFRKGDSAKAIAQVRTKLRAFGDLASDSGGALFDEDLEVGVRRFQDRMGIKADGVLGRGTMLKINTPVARIIRQIMVNMERCRWVPDSLTNNYFIVNIPAFSLLAYSRDTLAFTMKVVVGKALHKTVIFNGDLKYVVFSPYWNVPPDILKKEILPALQKDPNYLARNNMEWNGKAVRQKPGPKNSLGLVKFLFPNSYHIYFHDTPAKSLFNEDQRAFSHGCIRLAEPKKMAIFLLRDDPRWTEKRVDQAMGGGKEIYVTLPKPVPVYIAYLTAWADRDGRLNLRDDIYHRDEQLSSMILNRSTK